jgi:Zn-dependent protease
MPSMDFPEEHVGFHVSGTEILHLAVSMGVLSLAFAIAFSHQRTLADFRLPTDAEFAAALGILPLVSVIVLLGFLLHEMAHKLVAQRLHLWAEFRASVGGLAAALGFGMFTPFLFAAPGAVIIIGNATRRDGAIISIAGPAVNLVIGFAFLLIPTGPNPPELGPGVGNFYQLGAFVNAMLGLFNLLPFPPLDGSKIARWSIPVYLAMLAVAGGLFYLSAFR